MTPQNVVVVGGGVGGVSVCADLRRLGYGGNLTLLDQGTTLHDRPPLSKEYLLGKVGESALRLQPDGWFTKNSVSVRLSVTATLALPAEGYVELDDGSHLPADTVVLAAGGEARALAVPGANSARVHYLRTLSDAQRLRPHLLPGRRVLVVGAGLIGAEVAASAQALGCSVTLTDPLLPLRAVIGDELAEWLHRMHTGQGVRVLDSAVAEIVDRPEAATVLLTGADPVAADVVIVGIGMVPVTQVAQASGAMVDDGVVVDSQQRTSVPGLYAIGDCTRPCDDHGTLLPRVEHWEGAIHAAARAAASICGAEAPASQTEWFWTDRYGHHVEVVGTPTAGASVTRGEFGIPPFSVLAHADGHLVGVVSADDPHTVRAARRIIDRRTPVTADDLLVGDLRKLARVSGTGGR